jgi:outer membrane lipoprotein-sorting protein
MLVDAAEAMEAATEDLSTGHAIVEVTLDTPEQSGSGTVEVWGRMGAGPNGEPAVRAEVLASSFPEAVGMTFVSDGSQFWMWDPAENRVLTGTADEMRVMLEEKFADYAPGDFGSEWQEKDPAEMDHPETPEEAVDKLLEYFTAERAGSERVGDANADKLRLIPIPEQMPDEVRAAGGLLHVWLRAADDLPLGVEYTGGALGEGIAQATLLELNVELDEALFTFETPAGAEVMTVADLEQAHESLSMEDAEAAADFDVLEPAELPAGATLLEVVEVRGAIVQRYNLADGGSFTVAQGMAEAAAPPEIDGAEVEVRGVSGTLFSDEDGSRTLLTWQEDGLTFWVAGNLTAEQAVALAESLQ